MLASITQAQMTGVVVEVDTAFYGPNTPTQTSRLKIFTRVHLRVRIGLIKWTDFKVNRFSWAQTEKDSP